MSYALISFIHPWSESKADRLQQLLPAARDYYLSPESLCSTWTYFTPSTRAKAPFQQLSAAPASTSGSGRPLLIGNIEIYDGKEGADRQLKKDWFKAFHKAVEQESLYAREPEIGVWTPVGGFVAREARQVHREGTVVMLARFECKDGGKSKAAVVDALSRFAAWVKDNESATYTYSVMVRRTKGENNEVIMFERYRDAKAIMEHGGRPQFKAMFKEILPHIQAKKTKMAEWEEVDYAFVGSEVGKPGKGQEKVQLPAKL
ncbi:uncharacterized protein HMPREF1541_04734 [Cyphellophora europaea CBS 101466]|uniref:ABM domain-containing protein n=1 Tax=Cyphellophora europaea (strain CBS 101466) TaxID=1220924 RepID=W2RVJ8_CYPE1|nr:uncharacterized protein HMPREF1541_04734 [Cyphellophora europaea CBS 101466]ETN40457.1 hypothetical protein HMPREF1541_04734 [Cyphellophora europaea CBS 101466]